MIQMIWFRKVFAWWFKPEIPPLSRPDVEMEQDNKDVVDAGGACTHRLSCSMDSPVTSQYAYFVALQEAYGYASTQRFGPSFGVLMML